MKKETTHDRILRVASDLFYTQGYIVTGINQIIAEAKVAKASFYHHFASKEELCLAYLRRRDDISHGGLRAFVEKADGVEEKVGAFFEHINVVSLENRFRGCGFLNIASEIPDMDSVIREIVIQHKNRTRQYFLEIVHNQISTSKEERALADSLYILYEGAFIGNRNYGAVWPIEAARRAALLLLKIAVKGENDE